mmetsp:Transcript_1188/g.7775  ORF Transcript_1188/g.7775 Transcript_1188/m.7775 type:complete len:239 (-) Transcript_1188:116-832(-)
MRHPHAMWFHRMTLSVVEVPDFRIIEVGHLSMCVPTAGFWGGSHSFGHDIRRVVLRLHALAIDSARSHAASLPPLLHLLSRTPVQQVHARPIVRSFDVSCAFFRCRMLCPRRSLRPRCGGREAFHHLCFAWPNRTWHVRACVLPTHPPCFSFFLSSDRPRRLAHLSSSCAVARLLCPTSWSSPISQPFRHVHGRQGGPRPTFPCVRSPVRGRPSDRTRRTVLPHLAMRRAFVHAVVKT